MIWQKIRMHVRINLNIHKNLSAKTSLLSRIPILKKSEFWVRVPELHQFSWKKSERLWYILMYGRTETVPPMHKPMSTAALILFLQISVISHLHVERQKLKVSKRVQDNAIKTSFKEWSYQIILSKTLKNISPV